jgi:hypothetical protein
MGMKRHSTNKTMPELLWLYAETREWKAPWSLDLTLSANAPSWCGKYGKQEKQLNILIQTQHVPIDWHPNGNTM